MNYSKISVRYAKALFAVAKEKDLLENIKNDVILISEVIDQNHELDSLLQNPVLKTSKKKEVFIKIFESIHPTTISFINLLFENKREGHINDITRKFIEFYKEHKHIKTVILTTPVELDKKTEQQITDTIRKNLDCNIELEKKTDANIIGGFIIKVDDQLLDASVSSQLKKIEQEFMQDSILK